MEVLINCCRLEFLLLNQNLPQLSLCKYKNESRTWYYPDVATRADMAVNKKIEDSQDADFDGQIFSVDSQTSKCLGLPKFLSTDINKLSTSENLVSRKVSRTKNVKIRTMEEKTGVLRPKTWELVLRKSEIALSFIEIDLMGSFSVPSLLYNP